jgi:hypothetical protein
MNCPFCGATLAYVRNEGDTYVYHCLRRGALILPPDGRMRQEKPTTACGFGS